MKRNFIIVLSCLTALLCGGCDKGNALNVNDIAGKPASFAGKITVTGVMAARSQDDPTVLGIIDTRELKCTTPNCNRLVLPVRYRGAMPAPGDEMRVTGSFLNEGRGYIFSAETLKVLKHHKPGG